jgi:hypothetical protein
VRVAFPNGSLPPVADIAVVPDSLAMIDFEQVWLPQIIEYARLVSTGQIDDEWLGRTKSTTSITDPDELYEQVFDDLDAEAIWAESDGRTRLPHVLADAITRFLTTLSSIDESDARSVLSSSNWADAKKAASDVVANVS